MPPPNGLHNATMDNNVTTSYVQDNSADGISHQSYVDNSTQGNASISDGND